MATKKSNSSAQAELLEHTPADFEAAMAELETLVARMDQPQVGLDVLLTDYRRGAFLVKYCRDRLSAVKAEVAQIDQSLANSDEDQV